MTKRDRQAIAERLAEFGRMYRTIRGLASKGQQDAMRWVQRFHRLRLQGPDVIARADGAPF